MIYKLAYRDTGYFEGFYNEEINKSIPDQTIKINEELWKALLSKSYKIKDINLLNNNVVYAIENLDLFEEYIPKVTERPISEIELLKEEILIQSATMVDLDFRLTTLELGL